MKFDLTVQEVNLILQALGNAPYAQVFELVEKIREQAAPQLPQQDVQRGDVDGSN